MHHVADVRNIQSAGCQVGRDKDVAASVTELIQRPFAVVLLHSAVECLAIHLHGVQVLPYPVHTLAMVAEHQRRFVSQGTQQLVERFQLVLHRRSDSIHRQTLRHRFLRIQEIQLQRAVHARKTRNLLRIGSRQQEAATQCRQLSDDLGHLILKAELQTLVELVDDQHTHGARLEILLVQVVVHTSRRTDNHRRRNALHGAVFLHSRTSAVTAHHRKAGRHGLEHLLNLQS